MPESPSNDVKLVEWPDQSQCLVGSYPGRFCGGSHGPDERTVSPELMELVKETVKETMVSYEREGRPLPSPTAGRDSANRMLTVA